MTENQYLRDVSLWTIEQLQAMGCASLFGDADGKTWLFFQGNSDKGKTWLLSRIAIEWPEGRPAAGTCGR